MKCKKCNRKLPNNKFKTKHGCVWCDELYWRTHNGCTSKDWFEVLATHVRNMIIDARIEELHNFTFHGNNRDNVNELSSRLQQLQQEKE